MSKRLVVANWKMYVATPKEVAAFGAAFAKQSGGFAGVDVWVAPPALLIAPLCAIASAAHVKVGAQHVSAYPHGAHTGDISAAMVKAAGATFTIVGHSEERAAGQSDTQVRDALMQAVANKLVPVLCVGEEVRDANGSHFEYIAQQLHTALQTFPKMGTRLVVAYEPVWAIGKSAADAMKPSDLQEMHIFIRKTLTGMMGRAGADQVPVLYGGSVEVDNAPALIEEGGVAGFLVGHASADPKIFIELLKSLCKPTKTPQRKAAPKTPQKTQKKSKK
jgi:triosephosphate isomerase